MRREEEKTEEEDEEVKIDWSKVRLLKVMYFLSGLTGSTWGRFAAIYFNKEKHLSPSQIGTYVLRSNFVLSNRTHNHKITGSSSLCRW